jgi:hypothetical protein
VVVKTLRHRHRSVMKSIYNAENKPLYLEQNNKLKEMNIGVKVCNTFHYGSSRGLEPHLPCHRCISTCFKKIKYHCKHLLNINKKKESEFPERKR